MATISSTLQMYDAMTKPLSNITQALNMTISAMETLQNAADQEQNLTKTFEVARSKIADAETQMNMMASSIEEAENRQKGFNDALKNGENYASGLFNKIVAFAGAYLGYQSAKGFFGGALEAANEQIRAEQRLQSIMGNINGMTQDGINLVKNYAKEIERATGVASSVGIFGQSQLAQYVYDPTNIVALTDSMYNLATETYGVGFTMEQLMQTSNLLGKVMSGDINALSRNGFRMDAIFTEAEQQLLRTGTEAERAALVIQMIEENLDGLAEAMRNTPEGAIHALGNAWGSVQETIGYGLIPIVLQFVDMMEANMPKIQDVFVNVFDRIFQFMENFLSISGAVVGYFIDNWSKIEPIIWGIVAGLGALWVATQRQAIMQAALTAATIATTAAKFTAMFVTHGLAAAWGTLNAVMKANVIILVISALAALGMWLYKTWQKNDEFAAGLMRAWNTVLNFFGQVRIFFAKLEMGIVNSFMNIYVGAMEILDSLVSGVIGGINLLIDQLNRIPGVSIDAVSQVEFTARASLQAEAVRQAGEEAIRALEQDAAIKAAEREQKVLDMLDDRAAKRALEAAEREERFSQPELFGSGGMGTGLWDVGDNTLLNIDKVGEVGRIRDSVDISSEDLKMMRELAEMRNIQNFVTLQPQMTFGDTNIRQEGRSIEEIVANINERLTEELAISAQQVLNV